uniref:DUF1985 domain-containing protein n=1 Tax=Lactuca sativa TaxID=4236 RepID=A0A9R1UYT7_LACSA|nr:hypothetical protein LSAT_V11C700363650 [Lactuca sativa]
MDGLLFHNMSLHQIRSDVVLSPDEIKPLYFRVGDTKMVYGPEEFFLITGLNFGEYPKNIGEKVSEKVVSSKKRCLLCERLFPNYTNILVKIGDLKSFILNQPFLEVADTDVVRVCLITILYEGFLGKEINDRVLQDWFFLLRIWMSETGSYLRDFTYENLEDTWNKINKYLSLSERRQTLKYSIYEMRPTVRACEFVLRKNSDMPWMKRWSDTKNLKWVDVNKIFSKTQEGQPPRNRMSPIRDHFRRQDESSSSMSSSGRSHCRGGRSGKPNLEEVLKRLHTLEQHVFMNREPIDVFVEEVNNEDLWNNISFEGHAVFQTNFDESVVDNEGMNKNNTNENVFGDIEDDKVFFVNNYNVLFLIRNKFDDVFDVNDYNEAKEVSVEDEVIITGNVNYYDAYGFDGKEVTLDRPRARNSSKYLCPPYTELHTTLKQKRRPKKKVDIESTSPVPPPAFAVVHDFFVLRLQPYVAGDRDFWSALFGQTHDGWLKSLYHNYVQHITIWYELLMERRFDSDRRIIMPPNFFVFHAREEGHDWRAFMAGIATYPNFMVAWWDVDTVN